MREHGVDHVKILIRCWERPRASCRRTSHPTRRRGRNSSTDLWITHPSSQGVDTEDVEFLVLDEAGRRLEVDELIKPSLKRPRVHLGLTETGRVPSSYTPNNSIDVTT
mmetsp:Transcript_26109/g.62702  ORF Transcript_26109/g.62702 Transcript_26109/m.62702 type:complete len:108 (-) Transcript_26109:280-603(-)